VRQVRLHDDRMGYCRIDIVAGHMRNTGNSQLFTSFGYGGLGMKEFINFIKGDRFSKVALSLLLFVFLLVVVVFMIDHSMAKSIARKANFDCYSGHAKDFVQLRSDGKIPHGPGLVSIGERDHVATYDYDGKIHSWIYGEDQWHEFTFMINHKDAGGFFFCEKQSEVCHQMGDLMQCYKTTTGGIR